MQYQDVDFDDLKLVRVVKSLENSEINGDQFILHKASDNQSASLRNTLHFTLNTVVQDHAYGTFSDSRYAVIADLKETADQNKIVGLNEVDTFFWQNEKGTSLNKPTLFIPDNDTSSLDKFSGFNTVAYKSDEDAKQNFNNLTQAIKENFQANKLPFHSPGNWGWSGKQLPKHQEFKALEQYLGATNLADRHDGSVYSTMESLKSRVQILVEDINAVKDQQNFENLQVGHEADVINTIYGSQMEAISHDNEIADYFKKHLGSEIGKLNDLYQEQINLLYPEPQIISATQPPPIPQGQAFSNANISVDEAIRLLKSKENAQPHLPPPLPKSTEPTLSTFLDKFAQQSTQAQLQFKSALTGIYNDSEFQRIKQYERDSNQAMKSAVLRLTKVLNISTEEIESPFSLLQKINQCPNAKEQITQEFAKDPELKTGFEQDLKNGINNANLYQSNLALYTQDVATTVEQYASQDINDPFTQLQYKEILNDLNGAFDAIGRDNSLKLQQVNLYLGDVNKLTCEDDTQDLNKPINSNPLFISLVTMDKAITQSKDMTTDYISRFNDTASIPKEAKASKLNELNNIDTTFRT